MAAPGSNLLSDSSSLLESGSDGEAPGQVKRKRSGRTMAFLEGLMARVLGRQEAMQRRFLEAVERREQESMRREEAWKAQETARIAGEHERIARERAAAAARDAALIAFLRKLSGPVDSSPSEAAVQSGGPPPAPSSSRWPKAEVHALICIRTGLESRYHDAGPKGPLWEDVSGEMRRLGYCRSAKRCKEKWENINKYFKKVRDGSKRRAEDSKTCPYFHQLDALHRGRSLGTRERPQPETDGNFLQGSTSGETMLLDKV